MKKFAVFCPVKNESTFSSIWIDYYSRFLPIEDIYFLDFNSDSTNYKCNIIKSDKNILDANQLFQSIKETHKELLSTYEYVIPTDVDEILFHPDGLDNYINNFNGNYVKCSGYEIIHMPNIEPDFNNSKKILDQRRFWFRSQDYYDKTLITNKPLNWTIGLHTCYDPIDTINSDLLLIHLHRFDYRICIDRHLKYANLDWSDNTIINNYNWHYRTKEEESIRKWYFSDINNITEIPNELKVCINI